MYCKSRNRVDQGAYQVEKKLVMEGQLLFEQPRNVARVRLGDVMGSRLMEKILIDP